MGIVRTNTVTQSIAPESSVGVKPTAGALILQPNTISDVGAEIESVARTPISRERQHEKGAPVGLTSKATFEGDLIMHHLKALAPAAFFAIPNGPAEAIADGVPFRPTSVSSTAYVVAADGDLTAGLLIYARGFLVAGNNGLKVVGAASDATHIKTAGLAAEATTTPQNATVEICGIQGAVSDIVVATAATLTSTILDFTTLGITVGQFIQIGDTVATDCSFATAASNGLVRVTAIAAHTLTFDKSATVFVGDAGTGKTIRLFFGTFIRNVSTSDADFNFQSHTIETELPNLDAPDPMWIYQTGNYLDEFSMSVPLKGKGTVKVGFVGTDTEVPTSTQTANWDDAYAAVETTLFNTTSDVARLRVANGATDVTAYWKSLTVTTKNNLSPLNVIGVMGALDVNYGFFDATFEGQALLTDGDLVAAVRNNTTLTFDFALQNADGAFVYDVPSCTVSNGKPELPVNEDVLVSLTGTAHKDATYGYSASISIFPYLPA